MLDCHAMMREEQIEEVNRSWIHESPGAWRFFRLPKTYTAIFWQKVRNPVILHHQASRRAADHGPQQ